MNEEEIRENRLYFIKDEFFDIIDEKYLKQNKENTKRPHFCLMRDSQTNLLWMIPCSRNLDKFKTIIQNKESRHKKHNQIQIIKVNGIEEVFLYQDMFPIIAFYIEKEYKNSTGIFEIKNEEKIKQIKENGIKIIKLLESGTKFMITSPDIKKIEKKMLEEKNKTYR